MKTIFKTATHEIKIPDGARVGDTKENVERQWRDSELGRTDILMSLSDYPDKTELTTYRQSLRDYPASRDFPNGQRPGE